MMPFYDRALKVWTGAAWYPATADWEPVNAWEEASTAVSTSLTETATPTTVNNGSTTVLRATMNPTAATGTVKFTGNFTASGNIALASGTCTYTASPTSTGTATATYTPSGSYLASSGTVSVTVKQKSVKKATHSTRNSWQWGMSSAPHTIQSTFGVNTGTNDIPYSSAVITGCRIQVAGYYGRSDALGITQAGIYNSSGTAVATVAPTLGRAASSDTPLSGTFDVPDYTVTTGTYRIGFVFPGTMSCQWDEHTGASGYTTYEDGGAIGSQSLLWEIDYYIWA